MIRVATSANCFRPDPSFPFVEWRGAYLDLNPGRIDGMDPCTVLGNLAQVAKSPRPAAEELYLSALICILSAHEHAL